MFAKLARFHGFGHPHAAPLKAASCNDNHPIHRSVAVSRPPRHTIACAWRRVPATGRLECFWQVDTAAAGEPAISWMTRETRRLPGDRPAGKSAAHLAAA
jgi:hypothetical protein